ncbi:MAG: hypothetical protein DMF89_13555 [Acidobacteria bacterium]|nr:MAG: hypothetical protein DMF89_13555 [Acidobacteriota bacterium]
MSVVSDWSAPPPNLGLLESDVHVWRAFLDSDPRRTGRLANVLSQDVLRAILGRYSGRAASTIEFAYGSAGKPRMASPQSDMAIAFNVSQSGGLALYAFARNYSRSRIPLLNCERPLSQQLVQRGRGDRRQRTEGTWSSLPRQSDT